MAHARNHPPVVGAVRFVRASCRRAFACIALWLVCCLPAPAQSPESRFEVDITAPPAVQQLLRGNLDIVRWKDHPRMDREEFERLFRRVDDDVRALLETQGYYRPRIASRLGTEGGTTRAVLDVDPGEPVRVGSVDIAFRGALAGEDAAGAKTIARLREGWAMKPGEVFRHPGWEAAKGELLRQLALDVYPRARIAGSRARVQPERGVVDLDVTVDSGPAVRFGPLVVEGLQRYPGSIVDNLRTFEPGEPYSLQALQDYQARLLDSGYFTSVTVDATSDERGVAPVRVAVSERESRRIAFGIGYSTDTGVRAQAEYRQLNLFERGLQFGARVKLAQRAQSAGVDLHFPTEQGGYRNRLVGEITREDVQGVTNRRTLLLAGRARRRGNIESDVSISYTQEQQQISGSRNDSQHALTANWAWTTRRTDSPLFPTSGYLFSVELNGAPGLIAAETTFVRTYVKAVRYFRAGDAGVLTLRGELGNVFTNQVRDVPFDFLFRTGGDRSVRGYAYQSLGVVEGAAVTGGAALAVVSAEYTHWLTPDWGAAVFWDAGNAARRFADLRLVHGYGAGVRWRSPVGPLNLDVAYGREEEKVRLHFSVGIPF